MDSRWYLLEPEPPKLYSGIDLGCSMRLRGREWLEPIENWDDREIAVYGPHDFVVQDLLFAPPSPFILVSSQFRAVIEGQLPDEVNFYPIRLQRTDGSGEHLGYSLGQVLHEADCIDPTATKGQWRERGGEPVFQPFDQVATIRSGFSTPYNIFRPIGQSAVIYVSQLFKEEAQKGRMKGCRFTPLPSESFPSP